MIPGMPPNMGGKFGLVIGKVVDVHPEHNSVDVRVLSDNRKLVSVPVVGGAISGNTGSVNLPIPDLTTARAEPQKWDSGNTDQRDTLAVIGFAEGAPLCLGFISPPLCELHFPPSIGEELKIDRHASDFYHTIDRDGNAEWFHPSGTYIRIGDVPEHEDLTKRDYDKLWEIRRNKEKKPWLRLNVTNINGRTARIDLAPDGVITIEATEEIRITTKKVRINADVEVAGTVQAKRFIER